MAAAETHAPLPAFDGDARPVADALIGACARVEEGRLAEVQVADEGDGVLIADHASSTTSASASALRSESPRPLTSTLTGSPSGATLTSFTTVPFVR